MGGLREKYDQEGSKSRDRFKYLHKEKREQLYATDADLFLVEKLPIPFIVALLDFKCGADGVTFTEGIAYNELVNRFPIFIVRVKLTSRAFIETKPEKHRFDIERFSYADWRPFVKYVPTETELIKKDLTWQELFEWEMDLREQRKKVIENNGYE